MKEMCILPSKDKHQLWGAFSSQIPLLQSVEGLSEGLGLTSVNMDTDEILNQYLYYHDKQFFSENKNSDAKMITPTMVNHIAIISVEIIAICLFLFF